MSETRPDSVSSGEASSSGANSSGVSATEPADIPQARQTPESEPSAPGSERSSGFLGVIERAGDKIPHPALLFLILCGIVIILSQALHLAGVSSTSEVAVAPVTASQYVEEGGSTNPGYEFSPAPAPDQYHIERETTHIEGLLTGDGIRFIFTSTVDNFNGFGVVGVILVAMAGVGVAEEAGLIGALIRKLVKRAPPYSITFIIVLVGVISSIASDAGYLVLIPLGAAAFYSMGRHPLAGLAAAYAGVSAAFAVNILITPIDGVVTQITNEALHLVAPQKSINLTANLYFSIASTVVMAIVMTIYTDRFLSRRLGAYHGVAEGHADEEVSGTAEARGLRFAGIALLVCVALILLLTVPSWGLLRNPATGSLINDSPFMDGLIFIITLVFLVLGICYGRGARTLTSSNDIMNAITKTFSGLAGLIFMLLIISQFIAYFNYSNIATVVATELGDALQSAHIPALWLLVLFILVIYLLDIIIPGVIPKWAIFAPIFVPLFYRLGIGPQTVLAAYRVGDSPFNVVTPLMVYLPFIVIVAQRYKKDAGIGTVISLMIPYALIVATVWILFFVAWYLLGIPLGPGAPIRI
jgi:para-aminobenzoyl-glutamate transporter family